MLSTNHMTSPYRDLHLSRSPKQTCSNAGRRKNARMDARFCRVAIAIASGLLDVDVCEIERPNRSAAATCEARHIAMYLAHVVFQVSLIRTGAAFGRDRTSIAHAVRKIEDLRDDPKFDAQIDKLEKLARQIGAALGEMSEGGDPQ